MLYAKVVNDEFNVMSNEENFVYVINNCWKELRIYIEKLWDKICVSLYKWKISHILWCMHLLEILCEKWQINPSRRSNVVYCKYFHRKCITYLPLWRKLKPTHDTDNLVFSFGTNSYYSTFTLPLLWEIRHIQIGVCGKLWMTIWHLIKTMGINTA